MLYHSAKIPDHLFLFILFHVMMRCLLVAKSCLHCDILHPVHSFGFQVWLLSTFFFTFLDIYIHTHIHILHNVWTTMKQPHFHSFRSWVSCGFRDTSQKPEFPACVPETFSSVICKVYFRRNSSSYTCKTIICET